MNNYSAPMSEGYRNNLMFHTVSMKPLFYETLLILHICCCSMSGLIRKLAIKAIHDSQSRFPPRIRNS